MSCSHKCGSGEMVGGASMCHSLVKHLTSCHCKYNHVEKPVSIFQIQPYNAFLPLPHPTTNRHNPFGHASNLIRMLTFTHLICASVTSIWFQWTLNVGEGLVRANEQRCSTIHLFVMTPPWSANERPVIKSRDLSWPIRVQHYEWDTLWPLDTGQCHGRKFPIL